MSKYIFALLVFISPAHADDWSGDDTYREAAYLKAHILDWAQTRNIAARPNVWHETNSILGQHPQPIKVDRYFLAAGLAHVGVSVMLPQEWRTVFQYASIVLENGFVNHNFAIGISAGF